MTKNSSQTTTSQTEQDLETARALHRALNLNRGRSRRQPERYSDSGLATPTQVNDAIEDGQGTSDRPEHHYYTKDGKRRRY